MNITVTQESVISGHQQSSGSNTGKYFLIAIHANNKV